MDNKIKVFADERLIFKEKIYRCAIGRSGIVDDKKEGDGGSPSGCFPVRRVLYRQDKVEKPISLFETSVISENDVWSDDVLDPNYNTQIKLPYPYRHEKLWREDDLYDVIVVLGHNDNPPVAGLGSAIFMHIARPTYTPTHGCVAVSKEDLFEILASCEKDTEVCFVKA